MTKEEHVKYWIEGSNRDFESSAAILLSERYDWCLFIGHLALEKILKALFVKTFPNKLPPRTHNLIRLLELLEIDVTDEQKIDLDRINDFNIQARYPDYKASFYKQCDKEFALKFHKKIEEFHLWFSSLI